MRLSLNLDCRELHGMRTRDSRGSKTASGRFGHQLLRRRTVLTWPAACVRVSARKVQFARGPQPGTRDTSLGRRRPPWRPEPDTPDIHPEV